MGAMMTSADSAFTLNKTRAPGATSASFSQRILSVFCVTFRDLGRIASSSSSLLQGWSYDPTQRFGHILHFLSYSEPAVR